MNRICLRKRLKIRRIGLPGLVIILMFGFCQELVLAEAKEGFADESSSEDISTQSISPESETLLKHLQKESQKAEERFRIALKEQREAAQSREQILIGIMIVMMLIVVAGIFIVTAKRKEKNRRPEKPASPSVAPSDSKTVIQKPLGNAEYVLDGRDEEGVRYVLTLNAEELSGSEGVVIGRNPMDTRYLINHEDVSRRHARITMSNQRLFVEDLESTNGTSVNGQSIDEKGSVAVANGDQLIIGSVVMKLEVIHD